MTSPNQPRKGEIWVVDFGKPMGHEQGFTRPAVVVSSDRMNSTRAGLVIVVPLTTTQRDVPSQIAIEPNGTGLRDESYAKVEDIKSVSVERLVRRIGQAETSVLARIAGVARMLLDL